MEGFLPVGSVVETNKPGLYMIIGYLPSKVQDDIIYDYICCSAKIGLIKEKNKHIKDIDYFYIKQDEIILVKYLGYNDKNFDFFNYILKTMKKEINFKNKNISDKDIKEYYENIFNIIKKDVM